MKPDSRQTAASATADAPQPVQRFDVALEPGQAWCLKGIGDDGDEIVIPGLLIDDFGNCRSVEATLEPRCFFQMLAMVALQENRMLSARAAAEPSRTRAEANIWLVDGTLLQRRLTIERIAALDRVVVDGFGTHLVETMRPSQLMPGPRNWK